MKYFIVTLFAACIVVIMINFFNASVNKYLMGLCFVVAGVCLFYIQLKWKKRKNIDSNF